MEMKKKLENVSREKVERLEIERKRGDNEIGRRQKRKGK